MADIKVSTGISGSKTGVKISDPTGNSESVGAIFTQSQQTITTGAAQALQLSSSQTDIGRIKVYNTDATNYIKVFSANGGTAQESGRISAGATATWELGVGMAIADLTFQADTASCKLAFSAYDRP